MMKKIIAFYFILLYNIIFSQNVKIIGIDKNYANDTITFFKYNDLINNEKIVLASTKIDSLGNFYLNFDIENTEFIFTYLGVYKAEMYIEPNKTYTIKLPEKKEKETKDKLNPYFKYTAILIGIEESDKAELNNLIRTFDYYYDDYIAVRFNLIRQSADNKLDSFIISLKKYFKDSENKYFKDYLRYKFYYLDFLSNHKDYLYITQYYYKNQPILYNNVAYMQLFNNLYKDFFFEFGNSKNGKNIYSNIVISKSPAAIKNTMEKEIAFNNDTLNNLIILKGLHDAYSFNYPNLPNYPKPQLNQLTDSLILQLKIPAQNQIAKNITDKFNKKALIYGKELPEIILLNQDSVQTKLSSFKDKYVLINVTMTGCVPCQRDMIQISKYVEKYERQIQFVTIVVNEDFETMKNFVKAKNYEWTFLHYGLNKNILKILDVEAIPKYILLDTYGKIILPSAPPPGEQFIIAFRKILINSK